MKVWWNPATWSPDERKFALSAAVCLLAVAADILEQGPTDSVRKKVLEYRGAVNAVRSARTLVG